MELKKIIVHELLKEAGVNESEINFSNELTPNDRNSSKLVSSLIKSYSGDKISYAVFDKTDGNYFPDRYERYSNSSRSQDEFIEFTVGILNNLNKIIRNVTLAKGGYFLFTEYISQGTDFVGIFFIRDKEGNILNKTKDFFEIQQIMHLDTSNLAMACRINEDKYKRDDINYLTFTQIKNKSVSDYFLDWISVERLESSREYTDALYSIVNNIKPPVDSETNKEYSTEVFRDKVYDFVKASPNKTVNLHDLGLFFYKDKDYITNYAYKKDISIDTEFRYNQSRLSRFIKISVNRDGINLKVSRGDVNDKIWISEERENTIYIESASFVEAFKKQMSDNND